MKERRKEQDCKGLLRVSRRLAGEDENRISGVGGGGREMGGVGDLSDDAGRKALVSNCHNGRGGPGGRVQDYMMRKRIMGKEAEKALERRFPSRSVFIVSSSLLA